MDKIEQHRKYYESCLPILKELYDKGLYEDCLLYAQKLAFHLWYNFSGLYFSQEIEQQLYKLGKQILRTNIDNNIAVAERHSNEVLHICSELYHTGGHTKLLFNWITNDKDHKHKILSTRMNKSDLQQVVSTYINIDLDLYTLNSLGLINKANELLTVINYNYAFIVLHIHPDDILPNVVLSQNKIKSPVIFLNHADHTFWLGVSISDIIAQIREPNIQFDKVRRKVSNGYFLPIPIEFTEAKESKTVPGDDTIKLLSIGSEVKYTPNKNYNFYAEMLHLANKYSNLEVNLIGIDKHSHIAKQYSHPNINYIGTLPHQQLHKYRENCTIYIEGFPVPSFTALLETAMCQKPFILHYDPKQIFRLFSDSEAITYPQDLQEWRKSIDKMISDKGHREAITKKQYDYLYLNYSKEHWLNRLNGLYKFARKSFVPEVNHLEDVFFRTDNEIIVQSMHETDIPHLLHTERFGVINKIRLVLKSPKHYTFVRKLDMKQLVWYFFPFFFGLLKKIMKPSR